MEKLEWQLTKVRNENEVTAEARNEGRKVHSASLMDLCHLKNSELEPQHQKFSGRVVLRDDIVKEDSGSYAVFTEQGAWTQLMVSQWSSSGIFPRIHHIAALQQSPRVPVKMSEEPEDSTGRIIFMSMFNDISWDLKTMNRNANLTPTSFLLMREDFHQEDGHSSDLDQKRSGILLMIANHKENGTESRN